jgi:hypothetical protein
VPNVASSRSPVFSCAVGGKLTISALAAMAVPASALGSGLHARESASALGSGPTPHQVHVAVQRAEHSRQLWATINICNTRAHRDNIGIRGQMPALGFPARLRMTIQVDYWVLTAQAFKPVPGADARAVARLGTVGVGQQQGGHTFQFKPGAGLLSGTITFQWILGGKVVGQISKQATGGHRAVDQADPPHHSAATCTIH